MGRHPVSGSCARIVALGSWPGRQVSSLLTTSSHVLSPSLQEQVDDAWVEAKAVPGTHLFDGAVCRLEGSLITERDLHLDLSRTSYKAFIGTNARNPGWAAIYGNGVLANPLGTSAALRSSDGHLLFGVRSRTVALYPGHAHPFGGTVDLPEAGSEVDLFSEMQRELSEEAGIHRSDIADLRVIALARDEALLQPELIFAAQTSLDRATICSGLDLDEHSACWSIPDQVEEIVRTLLSTTALTPVLRATLLAWAQQRYGARRLADLGLEPASCPCS